MQVVLSGNQVPKTVEITQEAIDAGPEVITRSQAAASLCCGKAS